MQEQDNNLATAAVMPANFEFIFYLGNNIIIQRDFNAPRYNPNVKKSMNLYETISEISDMIIRELKIKNLEFMLDNDYLFIGENAIEMDDKREQNFRVQLKIFGDVAIERIFPASHYHPVVRTSVDIRNISKDIVTMLYKTISLSDFHLDTSYTNYKL
jgi:hypothetical protein